MNLYYIYQDENTGEGTYHWNRVDMWCYDEESVKVRLIGTAAKPVASGIVLTSNS